MSPWGYTSDLPPAADYELQDAGSKAAVDALQVKTYLYRLSFRGIC